MRWSGVDIRGQDECWPWLRGTDRDGYGVFGSPQLRAHRVAFQAVNGPIPAGMNVLHRCDNPPCCNPAHLFLGTQADNQRDRKQKGRSARGILNGRSRLTEAQVVEIRRRYNAGGVSQKTLALEYGVSQVTISKVVRRIFWPHVTS